MVAHTMPQTRKRLPLVPSQRAVLQAHLDTLLPHVRKLRTLTHAYSRGFIWDPDQGDWVLHIDPESGEEKIRMVWMAVQREGGNGDPHERLLVFEISFPDDRYDEVVEAGEMTDCLLVPTERQCWEWLHERDCYIELSRVGDATELRPILAVPPVKRIHPTPLHALYAVVCAVLERPRRL